MLRSLRSFWNSLVRIRYTHLGINNVVAIALLVWALQYFLSGPINVVYQTLQSTNAPKTLAGVLFIDLIAGLISTIVAVAFVWIVFNFGFKLRRVGRYRAFELDKDGNEIDWGIVTINYYPFAAETQHMQVSLVLHNESTADRLVLKGSGIIVDNTYLAAYYTQIGNDEERRSGALLYKISGDGKTWDGHYTFVDPKDVNDEPSVGRARWKRI